jgi:hypothetical protein
MNEETDKFSKVLADLKEFDGKFWLRILGQTHWQYNELPFWVLLADRSQIETAISVMQPLLRPLQDDSGADVTISFITFDAGQDCSHAYFKGEEFFSENAIDEVYEEPECGPRTLRLFDYEYPNDPWALKS